MRVRYNGIFNPSHQQAGQMDLPGIPDAGCWVATGQPFSLTSP